MIVNLQNEFLQLRFDTKGAQLQQIKGVQNQLNYLWNGDEKYWTKFSPVLFPIVGTLKDNQYTFQNQAYQLSRHGFARDKEFELTQALTQKLEFSLTHDEETLKVYPFEFELKICYELLGNSLSCTYQVLNRSVSDMYFSLGAHPGFAVPLINEEQYTDYYIEFENDDELLNYQIKDNLLSTQTNVINLNDRKLQLKHELFYQDALVFKNLKSKKIQLLNNLNKHGLTFTFQNFDYFGIWAAIDADFVCLEPWAGIADNENHQGNLIHKEGINKLLPNAQWQAQWAVQCY